MTEKFEPINARGSLWHRWDPHIHTPGTALNNGYAGDETWEGFLTKIEQSVPPIRALGITDLDTVVTYIALRAAYIDVIAAGAAVIERSRRVRLSCVKFAWRFV